MIFSASAHGMNTAMDRRTFEPARHRTQGDARLIGAESDHAARGHPRLIKITRAAAITTPVTQGATARKSRPIDIGPTARWRGTAVAVIRDARRG